jgi:AmmeMemoRadiSam system protein B
MATLERPRLRPGLSATQDESDPRFVVIWDQLRLGGQTQRFSVREFSWMQLFDGQRTLRDIQAEAMRRLGGELVPFERFTALIERLEQSRLLDGPVREPSCLGCYPAEPQALRRQLEGFFTDRRGPGLPRRPRKPDGTLRAALIPHIDYGRGGISYAWGFKEVVERTDAALFLIIGTSHYSCERFTLTRKDFKTPLGIARTDQDFIDRLVRHYGDGLFDDEIAHLPEHSIELEVVFLQYLFADCPNLRIVPLVVGSFHDAVAEGDAPRNQADIGQMIEALRATLAETPEPVCTIISGDLAHIGPKFGDPHPVREPALADSRRQDEAILRQAEAADSAGFFRAIAAEADGRRICGLPPTYTALEALRPRTGKRLHYDQYVHPHGHESVSFASVAFYA